MEREGEVGEVVGRGIEGKEMKKRGRRGGGEMRRRRGILIGGMVIGLLLGCNNGGEDPQKIFLKSVVSLGNNFLDVFTSFGEMAGSALGFKKDPQKSDVASYFKNIQKTVQGTKEKLEKIVADMEKENNPNAASVKTKVDELVKNKLNNIIDGAKTASEAIGDDASDKIGNVATSDAKGAVGNVSDLIKGVKSIVDIVLKNVGDAEAGDNTKAEDGTSRGGNNADGAGKLFANAGASGQDKAAAADAAKAVGAVSGADILQAIIKGDGTGDAAKLASVDAAAGSSGATNTKDATIAGGIALRAMAKGGKFANGSNFATTKETIKNAAVGAVTKALDTLTMAIRKTIDEGLKSVKEAMKINPETTPVNSEGTINK